MQVKAQLAQTLNTNNSRSGGNQSWPSYTVGGGGGGGAAYPASINSAGSPQSSMDSFEGYSEGVGLVKQEMMMMMVQNRDEQYCYYGSNNIGSCNNSSRKRASQTDLGELQALALRMMRN